jgi:hypothetical protein
MGGRGGGNGGTHEMHPAWMIARIAGGGGEMQVRHWRTW